MNNTNNQKSIVNWYPGHMKKTINVINDKIKDIDFYIEIVDARAIHLSSNPELNQIFNNKLKIKVALKTDLADIDKKEEDIIYASIYDNKYRKIIFNEIEKKCKTKIESKLKKGYKNIKLIGMVVGLPNVGKSSIINFLANSNKLIKQDKPGVTRKTSFIKINDNIVLFDTPGIFLKKVNSFEEGAILTLIKSVNFEIVDKYEILKFGYEFLLKKYNTAVKKYFLLNDDLSFNEFIEHVCEIKRFKLKNNENDLNRLFVYLYSEFTNGSITKINYNLNK